MMTGSVFSTDELPSQERAQAWRDWMSTLFFGLESDLYGAEVFEGHLSNACAGDVIMTRLDANRHRVIRSPRLARASEASYIKIIAPWEGNAAVEQHGRQAWVRPGGWAIYDTTGSYEVANPERSHHLIVMLPKEQLTERGLRLDSLMGRHVGGASGISRVALEAMRHTYQELPSMTPEAARGAGDLILEMVRLSLQELAGRGNGATQREAFKDRIRDYIGQHLRDPALSLDRIAEVLREQRVWGAKEKRFERLLPRLSAAQLAGWLQDAHKVDGIVKGLKDADWPADPWQALHRLALAVCRGCAAR